MISKFRLVALLLLILILGSSAAAESTALDQSTTLESQTSAISNGPMAQSPYENGPMAQSPYENGEMIHVDSSSNTSEDSSDGNEIHDNGTYENGLEDTEPTGETNIQGTAMTASGHAFNFLLGGVLPQEIKPVLDTEEFHQIQVYCRQAAGMLRCFFSDESLSP
jgi:hypothetical protein